MMLLYSIGIYIHNSDKCLRRKAMEQKSEKGADHASQVLLILNNE